jgi:hypothetical protein
MRAAYLLAALLLTGACSSTPGVVVDTQTVRDYVEVGELEDVPYIRVSAHDSWSDLTEFYVIYEARTSNYLIEFRRRCRELRDNAMIAADHRYDDKRLRAKEDTLRGCRIGKIYPLTEGQATELRNLGVGPGEGN